MNQPPTHTERCILTDIFGRDEIDERRLTVSGHHAFRESISASTARMADIDDELDDMTVVDPYQVHAPSRRSDKSLASFLDLIDNLPISNDGKGQTR